MNKSEETEIELLKSEVRQLHENMDKLNLSVKALLDAWTTAAGMVKMVKVLSTIAVTFSLVWFLGKDMIQEFFFHGMPPK